jgi:hypothetical protein
MDGRAWGFLLLAYTNAVGSGRLYLVSLPLVATLVIGSRAGYITP